MNHIEEEHEVSRLHSIRGIISEQIAELEIETTENEQKALELNKGMWEDAPHAVYDIDDMIDLQQYNMEIIMHKDWSQKVTHKLEVRKKMLQSPYFGRIDFIAVGKTTTNQIYIGISSLITPATFKCLIYDWRAPISSMYYEFGMGDASYQSPSGEIKGNISLKRQYKIVNGQFEYMLDSDLKIDDDILQKELSANSESKLKVIISSIQNEQNKAIRQNIEENLIIFGPAGSGKTSIGLHRLAYELYSLRGRITSNDTLIFSQNEIFSSYISTTIPELGEDDISRISFSNLNQKYLGEYDRLHDSYEQIEYFLTAKKSDSRFRGIQMKYSSAFLDFIRLYISDIPIRLSDVVIYRRTICKGDVLTQRYMEDRKEYTPIVKIRKICDFVEGKVEDYFSRHIAEFEAHMLSQLVDAKTVKHELDDLQKSVKEKVRKKILQDSGLFDAGKLYLKILHKYIEIHGLGDDIYDDTLAHFKADNLLAEDALVVLYVKLLTGEIEPNTAIQHVLIDEAQDFNNLQHFIIKSLFSASRYTILADMEQAMFPIVNLEDPADLSAIYGANVMRLSTSYRSTSQINALASTLLSHPKGEYFERNGEKPKVVHANELLTAIEHILASDECKRCDSIGIITKTADKAALLYDLLKGLVTVNILTRSTDTFQSGIVIIPVTLAKGLEFDSVIIPNCTEADFNGPYDRRILYLMCTRALHHLFFACTEELSPYFSQLADCYEEYTLS